MSIVYFRNLEEECQNGNMSENAPINNILQDFLYVN